MLLSQAFVPCFPSSLASIATIRHSFFPIRRYFVAIEEVLLIGIRVSECDSKIYIYRAYFIFYFTMIHTTHAIVSRTLIETLIEKSVLFFSHFVALFRDFFAFIENR